MNTTAIRIEFDAVPNGREGHGWIPMLWVNGRRQGHTYYARGGDKDEALKAAQASAKEEASHYAGDWSITINTRTANT